jgi:type VI secretion system protein VasD
MRTTLPVWILLLLCACAAGPPEPVKLPGTITVAGTVNPNPEGRPSPVVVRIFQLKTEGAFQSADFFALDQDQPAVLGGDLVAGDRRELRPGEPQQYEAALDPQTRFIAAVAAFRDLEHAHWRAVAAVPEDADDQQLLITLDSLQVQLSFSER